MGTKILIGKTDVDLQGNLALTHLADLVQFFSTSGKTGELGVTLSPSGKRGQLFFDAGELVHVVCAGKYGMDALVELLGWEKGDFRFAPGAIAPRVTLELPTMHAIMEAVRLRDERQHTAEEADEDTSPQPRSDNEMLQTVRDSADVLEDLLKVPGVDAVVVVGRDGFAIESTGNSNRVNVDSLGAALAHAINAVEEMGSELQVDVFQDLFIEYGRAVILCRPCGDAIAALVAPDASKLGIIRHKAAKHLEELGRYF
jgi:predicted regulator of Ras-like GTPase activity (Roadblock/LC7/MglB family)